MSKDFDIKRFKIPNCSDPDHVVTLKVMRALITFAHKGQKYGDMNYTYHLEDVESKILLVNSYENIHTMMSLLGYVEEFTFEGMKNILKALALGHDLIEDTFVTEELLLELGFPTILVSAIVAMTKNKGETFERYIHRLMKNPLAIMGKKADSFSNLQHSLKDGTVSSAKRVHKYTQVLKYLSGVDVIKINPLTVVK